jgi:hypothetical protein
MKPITPWRTLRCAAELFGCLTGRCCLAHGRWHLRGCRECRLRAEVHG